MQKYAGLAMDTAGNVLAQASVTVYAAGTTTLAPIFSDNAYTPLANPFTADADGTALFYGHGRYDVVIAKDGYTFRSAQTADILLADPMSALAFTLTGSVNDYAPTNGLFASAWHLTATAPATITGIAAGFSGQVLTITNTGTAILTFANLSGASAAANQLVTGGPDFTVAANQSIVLHYDLAAAKWRIVGMTAATTTSVSTGTTGTYRAINFRGENNATTPTTKYDLSADLVVGRNPTDGSTTIWTTAAATLDLSLAGPIAGGRDQAGSFTANSWVHVYWIGKADGTKGVIASAAAPPTGPTLPSGYTHWAYATALRLNASTQLTACHVNADAVTFDAPTVAVHWGAAAVETTVDCSAFVPPNAQHFTLWMQHLIGGGQIFRLRFVSGQDYYVPPWSADGASLFIVTNFATLPNVSQRFFYLWSVAPLSVNGLTAYVTGYTVPNGAA